MARQLIQDGFFLIPEGGFTVLLKKGADRHADPLFEQRIRVDESSPDALGQLPPDGGFTAAGQADEGDSGQSVTGR